MKTNAVVNCTDSAFDGSMCLHTCPDQTQLTDKFGEPVFGQNIENCYCKKKDCQWTTKARKARCRSRAETLFLKKLTAKKSKKVVLKSSKRKDKSQSKLKRARSAPWCVHIEAGEKVLVRNQNCICPNGWRKQNKCISPRTDSTYPCAFSHALGNTEFSEEYFTDLDVVLNCQSKNMSWEITITGDGEGDNYDEDGTEAPIVEGPIFSIVVPGHTTVANLKNANLFSIKGDLLEGAYRLNLLDLSENYLTTIPAELLRTPQIVDTISFSQNQLDTLPGDLLFGLAKLRELDLSHNMLEEINRFLFQGNVKTNIYLVFCSLVAC